MVAQSSRDAVPDCSGGKYAEDADGLDPPGHPFHPLTLVTPWPSSRPLNASSRLSSLVS